MIFSFIDQLKSALKEPLPGQAAQQRMMPISSGNRNMNQNVNATPKEGSVLILLYPKDHQIYFPLMLRPNYNGVHGGQISLPGGRKELYDKDHTATATREAEEEIGVKANDIIVLGQLTELYVFASNFKVTPVLGYVSEPPMFIPNPYEVESIIETSLEDLLNKDRIKTKKLNVRGFEIEAPYFDVDGNIVWGATAMILSEFKALLEMPLKVETR